MKEETPRETPWLCDQAVVNMIIYRRITAILTPVRFPANLLEGEDYPNWIEHMEFDGKRGWIAWSEGGLHKRTRELYPDGGGFESPYGYSGDWIYVKEGFNWDDNWKLIYRADFENPDSMVWAPAQGMTKEQARLWLKVGTVKCQRLSDITDTWIFNCAGYATTGRKANSFRPQWNAAHAHKSGGIYAWDRNPWVWSIYFRLDRERSKNV